jgi:hypothetical protein
LVVCPGRIFPKPLQFFFIDSLIHNLHMLFIFLLWGKQAAASAVRQPYPILFLLNDEIEFSLIMACL